MKTKISVDSKLMENQKQAEVMAAGKMFQALQTAEGHALFFSIGTDNNFYLTREIPGDSAGWRKTNLGSSIGNHKVKHFVVSQNHETNLVDIVIAVEIDGNDRIYTALNLINDHTTWEKAVLFAEIPYDNKQVSFSKFVVSGLFTAETAGSSFTMVDLIQDPDSQNQFFYRFILDPFRNAGKNAWIRKPLGSNLTATKSVISCVGRMAREEKDGVYTFGSVNNKEQLLYTPLFNDYAEEGSDLQAEPIRLEMPHKASAIAVSEIQNNLTNLYVSADGKLYLFKSDLQDGDTGTVVLEHALLKDVTQLHINTGDNRVYVWGLNKQGQIFYTSCQRNKETTKDAWSVPVPILRNVTQIATYLNKNHSGNVIFAHIDGKLIQLTQDPVTTLWKNRNIVLPTTDMMSVLKFNTFTTHISLTDETNKAVANAEIEISSVSPVSVYVNNQFEILSAENPLQVRTDITGSITILQQTDTIAGVCYNLKTKGTREKIIVNPMIAMLEKMAEVKNGSDLGNVQITDENGNQKPLVGSEIDNKTKNEVAQSMSKFIETAANMPQDGSVKKIPQTKRMLKNFKASSFKATKDNFWGLTFTEDNKVEFYEGSKAMLKFGAIHTEKSDVLLFRSADNQLHNIFDDIASTIGDIFNFIREGVSSLLSMTVMVVEGVYHFIIDIANKVYRCVLDSVNAVISAIELVYNKIAVFFEDLVKWIGFLFQWKDILATKNVMKNVYLLQIDTAIAALSGGKAAIHSSFGDLKNMISTWADLPVIASTPDATSASANPGSMNSSEANYGVYQLNSNKDAMVVKENTLYAKPVYEELFDNFMEFLYAQGDTFSGAYNAIKTEIIDKFGSLSVTDIIKKFVAIIANTLLGAVEHLLVLVVDILIALAQTVRWLLTAEVDIPVISWLYEKISDSKLTLLDLICLVSAIPATIVHKAINSAAPFPNGEAFTNSLINAKAEAEIKEIFKNNKTVAKNYMIVSGYYATIGSVVMIICDSLKESCDVLKVKHPAWLGQLTGAAYCCYQSPKRAKRLMTGANPDTFQKLDGMLTDMFMLRAAFDTPKVGEKGYTIAKWFDFALHLVWNVPVMANIAKNHGEATGKYKALIPESIADFAFNLAGVMAPIPDMVKNPEAKAAAYGVKYGMMLTYGIVSPVAAHLKAE